MVRRMLPCNSYLPASSTQGEYYMDTFSSHLPLRLLPHLQNQATMRTGCLAFRSRILCTSRQQKPRFVHISLSRVAASLSCNSITVHSLPSPHIFPAIQQYNFAGTGYLTMEPVTLVRMLYTFFLSQSHSVVSRDERCG